MTSPLPNHWRHTLPILAILCLSAVNSPAAEVLRGALKHIDAANRAVTVVVKGQGDIRIQLSERSKIIALKAIAFNALKDGDRVDILGAFSADRSSIRPLNVIRLLPESVGRGRITADKMIRSGTLRPGVDGFSIEVDGATIKLDGKSRRITEQILVGFEDILPGQDAIVVGSRDAAGTFMATSLTASANPVNPRDSFIIYEGNSARPSVLILGDSISMGYTLPVRAKLEAKANVFRPGENCFDTDVGLEKLDEWLGDRKWAVIHFNWGLHDVKHMLDGKLDFNGAIDTPLDRYEANLRLLVERLQKTGARLIWASTTPVPADSEGRKSEDIPRYNAAAKRVMEEMGVEINDLCAFVLPRHEKIMKAPGNVHYNEEGSELLAQRVAKAIEARLP